MNVALRRRTMTEAEFLDWAEPLERRYEFDGAGPVAIVGTTEAHGVIQANLLRFIGNQLAGSRCRALCSDTFARVSGSLRLPDVLVICRDIQNRSRVVVDPIVVFEILIESTCRTDRFTKSQEYWNTPSIQHYAMVEQDSVGVVVLSRGPETWLRVAVDQAGSIELPAIAVTLPLSEIYDGLNFPQPETDPEPV